MIARAGDRTTAPQTFIGERAIGGGDELRAPESLGELDQLLSYAWVTFPCVLSMPALRKYVGSAVTKAGHCASNE